MNVTFISMLAMLFALCLVIVPIAIGAWLILKLVNGGRGDGAGGAEESQLIQELHQGLARMERRVESLETLLLERERKEARHDL